MGVLDNEGLAHLWTKIKNLLAGKSDVGHGHTWDDVTGEPFYDSNQGGTLLWDGNTEGLDAFDMVGDGIYTYYPVSDILPALSDLANGVTIEMISSAGVETVNVNDFMSYHNEILLSQSNSSVLFVLADNVDFYGATIPKKGVYFMHNDTYGYVSRIVIPNYTGFGTKIPVLRNESLPEIGWDKIVGKPNAFPPDTHSHDDITSSVTDLSTKTWSTGGVSANSDLNNYTTSGVYFCDSKNTTSTLSNCPTSVAFRLEVKGCTYAHNTSKVWQTIYPNAETSGAQRCWKRYLSSDGWGAWKKEFYWSDFQVISKTASTNSNGNVSVGLDPAKYQIISATFVLSDGSTTRCIPYVNGGTISVNVSNNGGTVLASKSGTFRCVYIEI